jgi:dihydrofolate reductase
MRKVKLQMQISLDGFVAGPTGGMEWMVWDWDDELKKYVTELTDSVDTILMGRVLYQGMSGHWTAVKPGDESYEFAQKMNNYAKVVFSKTLSEPLEWNNSRLAKGTIAEEVQQVKKQPGKDLIIYGGASTVSGFIKENLIDEYHLFVNPAALGNGLPIFKDLEKTKGFELKHATTFNCGIVVLCYQPKKQD